MWNLHLFLARHQGKQAWIQSQGDRGKEWECLGEDFGSGIPRVVNGETFFGKEKGRTFQSYQYLWGINVWVVLLLVACQADLDFKPFSLSGVNFTCHVIILVLIPQLLFFFFSLELIASTTCISKRFPCNYCGRQWQREDGQGIYNQSSVIFLSFA